MNGCIEKLAEYKEILEDYLRCRIQYENTLYMIGMYNKYDLLDEFRKSIMERQLIVAKEDLENAKIRFEQFENTISNAKFECQI